MRHDSRETTLPSREESSSATIRIWAGALLAIVAAVGLPSSAMAHPGAGIAVDRAGRVYFVDTGSGLWRLDTEGRLTRLSTTLFHWLAIDEDNRFANTRFPAGTLGTFVKVGSNPTVILSSDYPIALGKDGNLYFQSGAAGHLRLMKLTPSGETSVVADFPRTVEGEPLQYTSGMSAGPDGSLYYSEDTAIRRLDASGRFSTLVTVRAPTNPPSIPGTDKHPYVRGFAIGDRGATYVCDTGDARVLKLDPDGTLTQVLQTQSPWAPTAVATFSHDLFVLEYLHTANDVRREWLPRVRKIAADGTSTIVATLDQMPGAR